MLYSSIENSKIKELKKLSLKKYRDKTKMFLVEGEHLIIEAYKAGYLDELLFEEGYEYNLDTKINYVSKNVMQHLSSLNTPSKMIGICTKKDGKVNGKRILMLDDIQDPGNLGTIIRSSVAFGADTIILSEKCVDIYSPKVIRASQGMIFKVNIVISNLEKMTLELKNLGFKVMGTKVTGGSELKKLEKPEKFVIIMGNEGNGVKEELLNLCDEYIYIKMNETCESLNVAIATSIILYELGGD